MELHKLQIVYGENNCLSAYISKMLLLDLYLLTCEIMQQLSSTCLLDL